MDIHRQWTRIDKLTFHCGRFTIFWAPPADGPEFVWQVYWDDEYQMSARTIAAAKQYCSRSWKALECMSGIRELKRPDIHAIKAMDGLLPGGQVPRTTNKS